MPEKDVPTQQLVITTAMPVKTMAHVIMVAMAGEAPLLPPLLPEADCVQTPAIMPMMANATTEAPVRLPAYADMERIAPIVGHVMAHPLLPLLPHHHLLLQEEQETDRFHFTRNQIWAVAISLYLFRVMEVALFPAITAAESAIATIRVVPISPCRPALIPIQHLALITPGDLLRLPLLRAVA